MGRLEAADAAGEEVVVSIISFEEQVQFQALRVTHRRANTMDLKIAAIALAHDALLLSGNARDFAAIAGLRFEPFHP